MESRILKVILVQVRIIRVMKGRGHLKDVSLVEETIMLTNAPSNPTPISHTDHLFHISSMSINKRSRQPLTIDKQNNR